MYKHLLDFLKEQDVEYYRNFKLSVRSSIGIGGEADIAVFPKNEEVFVLLLKFLCENNLKFKVVGNLTNILISDDGFCGVMLFTSKIKSYYVAENRLYISAGASLSSVIRKIATAGYTGLNELYGIPGSVGGMVYNNAGAYGMSVSDCLLEGRVFSKTERKIKIFRNSDFAFSYRNSILQGGEYILVDAVFSLVRDDPRKINSSLKDIIAKRRASQPIKERSLGSVFKRHNIAPVSLLIDNAGLKGRRVGDAVVSEKHAGFIVNVGNATARDVQDLISLISRELNEKYGIIPETEIEFLG